jgi:hypothetical protein
MSRWESRACKRDHVGPGSISGFTRNKSKEFCSVKQDASMESRRRNLEREELVDGGWIYFQDGSYSNDQLNSTTATP